MKLEELLEEYNKDPTNESAHRLCNRIKMFARIVLKNFNLKYLSHSYEDLIQQAYACFFTIVDSYDKDKASLETFFMNSYKNHVIDLFRSNQQYLTQGDFIEGFISNSVGILEKLVQEEKTEEFLAEMDALFTNRAERYIYDNHISQYKVNYRNIVKEDKVNIIKEAKKINDTRTAAQIAIDAIKKLQAFFEKKYPKLKKRN